MGLSYSVEPSDESLEIANSFVTKSLHFTEDAVYTSVKDIIDAASRMFPDIETAEMDAALLRSVDSKYIRFKLIDEEPQPDVILNHKLLDLAELEIVHKPRDHLD